MILFLFRPTFPCSLFNCKVFQFLPFLNRGNQPSGLGTTTRPSVACLITILRRYLLALQRASTSPTRRDLTAQPRQLVRSTTVLRLSSFPTSSRNCKSSSTDIEPRFVLAIGYLPIKKAPYNTSGLSGANVFGLFNARLCRNEVSERIPRGRE